MAAAGIYQAMYGDEYGIQGRDPRPIYVPSVMLWYLYSVIEPTDTVGGSVIKQRLEQQILLAGKQVSLKKNILKKEEQFQKEFNNESHHVAKTEYSLFILSQNSKI